MQGPLFETQRIRAVEADPSFIPNLLKLFNDAANAAYVDYDIFNAAKMSTLVASMMQDAAKTLRTHFQLMLVDKCDGHFIGYGAAKLNWQIPQVAAVISSERKHLGYGTEAIFGLTSLSFREFGTEAVSANCPSSCANSIAMLLRNGFEMADQDNSADYDHLAFQMTKERWNSIIHPSLAA